MTERAPWLESILADVAALPESAERSDVTQGTTMAPEVHKMLVKRARERRISPASYVRRATMAMLAVDLGIPFSDLLALDPRMTRETGYAVTDPDGTAFGPWEIESLVPEAS